MTCGVWGQRPSAAAALSSTVVVGADMPTASPSKPARAPVPAAIIWAIAFATADTSASPSSVSLSSLGACRPAVIAAICRAPRRVVVKRLPPTTPSVKDAAAATAG